MKQLEMFQSTLSRIVAFAKASPSHLDPSLCERIGDHMPESFLLCKVGQGSQEEYCRWTSAFSMYLYF
jgi:hypothetical protein